MDYIRVKNWEKFQHYKNRTPPWIKFYVTLLDDEDFERLPDLSKSHLLLIWLLASRKNNQLPANEKWLTKHLPIKSKLHLQPLVQSGFIECYQDDSKVLQGFENNAMPETEKRQRRKETDYSKEFESFWKKFKGRWNPDTDKYVKVGKFAAWDEWQKLTVEEQRKAWLTADKVSGKYVPDACRWLKRKMFDDFQEQK